jgi:anti-sigma B factor antagonist
VDGMKGLFGAVHEDCGGFDVAEKWVDRVVVLSLTGELDMITSPQLDEAIAAAARKEPTGMIVDLTKVRFLASAVLVAAYLNVTRSAQFGIVADGVVVCRPLKLTGIDTLVMLFPTLEDALANFAVEPTGATA